MPCRPAAAPPAVPGIKEQEGWGVGAETTRKKVTVSKQGASLLSRTRKREEGALLCPSC